jgi:hypothetical protein
MRFSGFSELEPGEFFRIPEKTLCEIRLIGKVLGSGNGTGIGLFAEDDGFSNSWLMGVWLWARVKGFDKGVHLWNQSPDSARTFVNSNRVTADCGNCLQSVVMESAHALNYGTDFNDIESQHQSRDLASEHTLPVYVVNGQLNELNLDPIDWVGGNTGAVPAVRVEEFARWSSIHISGLNKVFVEKLTTERTIWLTNDQDDALDVPGGFNVSVQTLNGSGTIDLDVHTTKWTTTGASSASLADGEEGQVKVIIMVGFGGNGTLTPTNFGPGTSVTFDAVGDSVTLEFLGTVWWVVSNNGCVVI